uniref:Golgi apparatus protein 1 n=1 Tax=Cacopsylla melanoneura TaxID=428564 RepID=A0A8D9A3D6_9HEMI
MNGKKIYLCKTLVCILILIHTSVVICDPLDVPNYVHHTINKRSPVGYASNNLLMTEELCRNELHRLCHSLKDDSEDIDVFLCIQINSPSDLSPECQSTIWSHLERFISDDNLNRLFYPKCKQDLDRIRPKCKKNAKLLACMLDHKDEFQSGHCKNLLQQTEWIAFSDFRFITEFTDVCKTYVQKFTCGRVETDKSTKFSQGKTLECLQEHIDKIDDGECRQEVLRLSKLQSDDIKLDRVLYVACANDRFRLCNFVPQGQIYKCLMDHTSDKLMSEKCREQMLRRQVLIATDYQVSKRLARACKDDIRNNRCKRLVSDDREIRLAQILVCLENAVHNGTKVSGECQAEMSEHRRMLLTDYRLSPEIVTRCSGDIVTYCKGLETGGKTIHCLMDHARESRNKGRISPSCLSAVETLVKTTDVGEDWRVDPILKEACQAVVNQACKGIRGGDARVMSCLMDNLDTDIMTAPCEAALIQIQYFIARDFELDPPLYRACHDEATRLCHAKKEWFKAKDFAPNNGPLVLPCLFRYLYHVEPRLKLSRQCGEQVRRVMRQRAESVHLLPPIEQACVDDLGLYCPDRTGPGQEMDCLQEHLSELKPTCSALVGNFTSAQVQDVRLNPLLMKYCGQVIQRVCSSEMHGSSSGDVIDCLILHKNTPELRNEPKCRTTIEHFQLITAKDYHFTMAFKEACKHSAMRFCPLAKTKAQVVECLSTVITNDTLTEARFRIPRECRQQVRSQLLQQRENFELDPVLKTSCAGDVSKYCADVNRGEAQVLECLLSHKSEVSQQCHRALFHIEQQDLTDSSSDYALLNQCKAMIKFHCADEDHAHALTCLKRYKDTPSFDEKCKLIVIKRMIEQNEDYRFNPDLLRSCKPDLSKYCATVIAHQPQDSELEGKVIACLKIKFREFKLRHECEKKLTEILKNAALDYKLNPLLKSLCTSEIQGLCEMEQKEELDSQRGSVEECLKRALVAGKIRDRACRQEVAALIEEGRADIKVDPILHDACSLDLRKYCADVAPGNGRQLQCLETLMKQEGPGSGDSLQEQCKTMLKARMDMFINADALVSAPNSLHDVYGAVQRSPARRYLLGLLLSITGLIFLMGLLCGRIASRSAAAKRK